MQVPEQKKPLKIWTRHPGISRIRFLTIVTTFETHMHASKSEVRLSHGSSSPLANFPASGLMPINDREQGRGFASAVLPRRLSCWRSSQIPEIAQKSQKLELDTTIIMNLLKLIGPRSRPAGHVTNAIEMNRQNQRQIWPQRTSEPEL